jgi:hypothetical protein
MCPKPVTVDVPTAAGRWLPWPQSSSAIGALVAYARSRSRARDRLLLPAAAGASSDRFVAVVGRPIRVCRAADFGGINSGSVTEHSCEFRIASASEHFRDASRESAGLADE